MTKSSNTPDLPTVSHRIQESASHSETGSARVLDPFSGVLNLSSVSAASEEGPGRESIPTLSYLVLQSLVQRELVEREVANVEREPSNQVESSSGDSTERKVYEVIRDVGKLDFGGSHELEHRLSSTDTMPRDSASIGDMATGSPSSSLEFGQDDSPGGSDEIGLDELADKMDESTSEMDKNMSGIPEHMRQKDRTTLDLDRAAQSDNRPTRRDSANSKSSSTGSTLSASKGSDSGRPRKIGPESEIGLGNAIGRLPRLATLDASAMAQRAAIAPPTTASQIEVPPTLSPAETPSLGDKGGIDFGSPLASRPARGRANSAPTGAFQMTYQRAAFTTTSRTDRTTDFEEATSWMAANSADQKGEAADSGGARTNDEGDGPTPSGPPPPEIDLDGIDMSRLVDRVYDEFQRKTRIERERRGL